MTASSRAQLGDTILGYLAEILRGQCSITEQTIEAAMSDTDLAQILSGLFLLQEELAERETAKQAALAEQREALRQLRETQQQLLQREKLASLGALTAGIAHELRNPLNFINNFARLSVELAADLKTDLAERLPNGEADLARLLPDFTDLTANLNKIWQHGQRADRIIFGMLSHSRGQSGTRGPTDINKVVADSVGLAYHGMRARKPQWNVKLRTEYDANLKPIEACATDLERVFINILDNAFYATSRKQASAEATYEPTVSITTKELGGAIEIRLRDNGTGISDSALEKIFLPFFTTKPPGDGVGLGLSISHDIVALGHQGELRAQSTLGEHTEMIITLPRRAASQPASS